MVRVVGEGVDNEIHSIKDALRIADEMGLDLVEISPNANPPVCKLMDYKKFLFDQKKKQKENKSITRLLQRIRKKQLKFSFWAVSAKLGKI